MNTIAGAASFACEKRSRTREAPMPTIASTNSDADIEKNGTSASPATARRPGSCRCLAARQQDAVRDPGAEAGTSRAAQEVDDLGELGLGLVDPGHVRKGDPAPEGSYRRARERPKAPSIPWTFPARRDQQHEEPDEEERRPEAEQQALPPGTLPVSGLAFTTTLFYSSRSDSDFVFAKVGISVLNRVEGLEPA